MPHNHSPRCCCQHVYEGAIITAAAPCPSCTEHGELATLNNQCPEQSPSTGAQCTLDHGHAGTHQPTPQAHLEPDEDGLVRFAGVVGHPVEHHSAETMDDWLEDHRQKPNRTQPAECPSCHTPTGRPHTDYCQAPNSHRIRGGLLPDPASVPYGTEINGHRAMGDPVRWVQHWTTQTSQPAATTSQPPTHTRGARCRQDGGVLCSGSIDCECRQAMRVTHPMSTPHPLTAACAPLCNHTGYPTTPPPPLDDYPR